LRGSREEMKRMSESWKGLIGRRWEQLKEEMKLKKRFNRPSKFKNHSKSLN
jgi:hypothetical protein